MAHKTLGEDVGAGYPEGSRTLAPIAEALRLSLPGTEQLARALDPTAEGPGCHLRLYRLELVWPR